MYHLVVTKVMVIIKTIEHVDIVLLKTSKNVTGRKEKFKLKTHMKNKGSHGISGIVLVLCAIGRESQGSRKPSNRGKLNNYLQNGLQNDSVTQTSHYNLSYPLNACSNNPL